MCSARICVVRPKVMCSAFLGLSFEVEAVYAILIALRENEIRNKNVCMMRLSKEQPRMHTQFQLQMEHMCLNGKFLTQRTMIKVF